MAPVQVSIVSYNTREPLRRCLEALQNAQEELNIVVVDNASADGSVDMVAREFPDVKVIGLLENVGFAAGNNVALGSATGDYALILNPDVVVRPDTVFRLAEFLDSTPGAAAVAPLLEGSDLAAQEHLYRRFPSVLQVALFWTAIAPLTRAIAPLRRRLLHADLRGSAPVAVDQLPGAALLIRREALSTVGLLDPGYFMWWEDVDWCYRARQQGYSLHVLTAARCHHTGGASFAGWSTGTRVFQFYRAFYRFIAKYRMHTLARRITPLLRADLAVKGIALRAAGRPRDAEWLARTRAAVRHILQDMQQGRVPAFDAGAVESPEPAAELPRAKRTSHASGPAVDVVIVNWNGRRWLSRAIAALQRSTIPVRIIVVDNASSDGSSEYIRAEHPGVTLLQAESNDGYAGGANRGLAAGSAPYAFVMNPDVVVEPDHLEHLFVRCEQDANIGAAQGKLYRVSPAEFEAGASPREIIDSAGHLIRRSRMVVDRGQGQEDDAAFDQEASIFSACGAALFLRRSMLEDVAGNGEFFAESFFAYKEDVDLGWRSRVLGWEIRYLPTAIAYHVRGLPLATASWRAAPLAARRHSWKNHYLLMLRNDTAADLLRALPFVVGWELMRLGHALLRDPKVLPAYVQLIREAPGALRARRVLFARRRSARSELNKWFGADARPLDAGTLNT